MWFIPKLCRRCGWPLAAGLIVALSACGGGTTVAGTATATLTTAAASPTATATTAPPTATPTPQPLLQAQLVSKLLGNIAPNSNSSITDLACPAGYVVAGGGVNSRYSTIVPMQNAPLSAGTWRAEIYNTSGSQTISVQVQVDCLRAVGATLSSHIVIQGLGTIAVGGTGTAVASCPAGSVVAGGGFASGYPTFNVVWNAPVSSTRWQAEVYNTGTAPIALQVQVVCLSAPGLSAQVITRSLGNSSPDASSAIVNTSCPSGSFVGGGGLNAGGSYSFIEMWDAPSDTHTWRSQVYNGNPIHSLVAQTQFICLKRT